uniref:Putative secreted protein n=1 Tax=Ixodes ricinus TaxID=34613 RepID=A0A6B0UIV9_IXORI
MLLANPGCHPATRMFCGTSFFLVVCECLVFACACISKGAVLKYVSHHPPAFDFHNSFFFYYFLIAKECRFCPCKTKLSFRAKKNADGYHFVCSNTSRVAFTTAQFACLC